MNNRTKQSTFALALFLVAALVSNFAWGQQFAVMDQSADEGFLSSLLEGRLKGLSLKDSIQLGYVALDQIELPDGSRLQTGVEADNSLFLNQLFAYLAQPGQTTNVNLIFPPDVTYHFKSSVNLGNVPAMVLSGTGRGDHRTRLIWSPKVGVTRDGEEVPSFFNISSNQIRIQNLNLSLASDPIPSNVFSISRCYQCDFTELSVSNVYNFVTSVNSSYLLFHNLTLRRLTGRRAFNFDAENLGLKTQAVSMVRVDADSDNDNLIWIYAGKYFQSTNLHHVRFNRGKYGLFAPPYSSEALKAVQASSQAAIQAGTLKDSKKGAWNSIYDLGFSALQGQDITFNNQSSDAIRLSSGHTVLVSGLKINNCGGNGVSLDRQYNGQSTFQDLQVRGCAQHGVYLNNAGLTTFNNTLLDGNSQIQPGRFAGVYVGGASSAITWTGGQIVNSHKVGVEIESTEKSRLLVFTKYSIKNNFSVDENLELLGKAIYVSAELPSDQAKAAWKPEATVSTRDFFSSQRQSYTLENGTLLKPYFLGDFVKDSEGKVRSDDEVVAQAISAACASGGVIVVPPRVFTLKKSVLIPSACGPIHLKGVARSQAFNGTSAKTRASLRQSGFYLPDDVSQSRVPGFIVHGSHRAFSDLLFLSDSLVGHPLKPNSTEVDMNVKTFLHATNRGDSILLQEANDVAFTRLFFASPQRAIHSQDSNDLSFNYNYYNSPMSGEAVKIEANAGPTSGSTTQRVRMFSEISCIDYDLYSPLSPVANLDKILLDGTALVLVGPVTDLLSFYSVYVRGGHALRALARNGQGLTSARLIGFGSDNPKGEVSYFENASKIQIEQAWLGQGDRASVHYEGDQTLADGSFVIRGGIMQSAESTFVYHGQLGSVSVVGSIMRPGITAGGRLSAAQSAQVRVLPGSTGNVRVVGMTGSLANVAQDLENDSPIRIRTWDDLGSIKSPTSFGKIFGQFGVLNESNQAQIKVIGSDLSFKQKSSLSGPAQMIQVVDSPLDPE